MTSIEPQLLIFEDFFQDNRHEWFTKDTVEFTAKIESNSYRLEHKRARSCSWLTWNVADIHDFYEKPIFCIHAVLENVIDPNLVNPHNKSFFGVVWKLSDVQNYFEFTISENQYYRIAKRDKNNYG